MLWHFHASTAVLGAGSLQLLLHCLMLLVSYLEAICAVWRIRLVGYLGSGIVMDGMLSIASKSLWWIEASGFG